MIGTSSLERGAGPRGIALLIVASLLLVVVLAAQAADAARSHRRAAEGALRAYAGLAARQFLRRARSEVDYFALYPVVYMLSAAERQSPGAPLPDPDRLARGQRDLARAPGLLRHFFRIDLATGRLEASAGTPVELSRWAGENLPALLSRRLSNNGEVSAVFQTIAGVERTFVYAASPDPALPFALAFEIDPRALRPYLDRAFHEDSLLPGPETAGRSADDLVYLDLSDPWGREIFRAGRAFDPLFGISERIDSKDAGLFQGMRLRASVSAYAAGQLVPGGLPASRLPALAATLTLASGLLLAALLLARRERSLARMRSDFIAGVSHELRTPLAQIRLFAETLLRNRVRSEDERHRSLSIIDQEARRLTHLVENVLVFSRGERGAIKLFPESRQVAPIVRETLESFRPIAQARSMSLAASLSEEAVAAVDADSLKQILLNLLDNAARYGPSGQEISVGLDHDPEGLSLWVEDEGPGIPQREREEIWKKFVRLERDQETHRSGAGIGLAVVRDLATLQGGRVRVEQGKRGGARFVIELPLAKISP